MPRDADHAPDFDILEVRSKKAHFYTKGQLAHAAGLGYDSHGLNPGTPTIADFHAGWRQAEFDARRLRDRAETLRLADVLSAKQK